MVFFTLYGWLSGEPDFLQHNKPDSLHMGDFVLPIFIFASGMSLFFFSQKRKGNKTIFALDAIERFGKLAMVSFFLTLLMGNPPFTMDEVMLIAILSAPTLAFSFLPTILTYIGLILPPSIYILLAHAGSLPDFEAAYLGGYPTAIFYLPVMLFGFLTGKFVSEGKNTIPLAAAALILAILLLQMVPPYKMEASPSFMAFAALLAIILYQLAGRLIQIPSISTASTLFFEYLGRNSIRYWVMMFLFFIIPAKYYFFAAGYGKPLGLEPALAALASILFLAVLFVLSKTIDEVTAQGRKII